MRTNGTQKVGRFAVDIELSNYADVLNAQSGHLDIEDIRKKTVRAIVDSGATRLVLPQAVVKELGLPKKEGKVKVRYADGRRGLRSEVGAVLLRLQGREDVFSAVVEPKRETAFLGAIVLEDLDFLVDCVKMRLVPRDPDHIVSEIE